MGKISEEAASERPRSALFGMERGTAHRQTEVE